jgi:hypothetical protein
MMLDRLIEIIQDIFASEDGLSNFTGENLNIDETVETLIDALEAQGFDLSAFTITDIQEALQEAIGQNHSSGHEISFKGFTAVEPLADLQVGPTCGFEAIENFIQLGNPGCNNTLSDYLQQSELFDGGGNLLMDGVTLDPAHYQHILSDFGIGTQWYDFSHDTLAQAIEGNRGVLAVGDAHFLDPSSYSSKNAYHAFMITDITRGPSGEITDYKGLDSNFLQKEVHWSPEAIEKALRHSLLRQPLLISMQEMKWPYKTA